MTAGLFDQYLVLSDEETQRKFKEAKTQAEFNNIFHTTDDRDTSGNASHHSLGTGHTQASAGDHSHDGRSSRLLGNTPNMSPAFDTNANDVLALTNTTYAIPTGQRCAVAFKAPPSGRGIIHYGTRHDHNHSGGAGQTRATRVAPVLRTGATLGAGSDPNKLEGTGASPNDDICAGQWTTATIGTGTFGFRMNGTAFVDGLTPGSDYNIELQHKLSSATTFDYDVLYQSIYWQPLL